MEKANVEGKEKKKRNKTTKRKRITRQKKDKKKITKRKRYISRNRRKTMILMKVNIKYRLKGVEYHDRNEHVYA